MLRSERGFTLIEMVVVMACLGIIAMAISALFMEAMSSYSAGQTAGLVVSDVRFAMDQISVRLREARDGSVVVNGAKNQVDFAVWEAGTNSYRTFSYTIVGQEIRANNQPLCSYVQSLRFDFEVVKKVVTITVTTVSSVPGARPGTGLPMTFSTRVALRNYR